MREATTLDAAALDAANNLAWIYATAPDETLRQPAEAIALAERVCRSIDPADPMYPAYLDTLAASYAAAGRFDMAVETIEKAIELARSRGRDALLPELDKHRQLYAADRPYIDDTLRSR